MEERVHPIPFRTRKLSSPSPMILHNVMWESRPLSTIAPKPLAAASARGFVFYPLRMLPSSRASRLHLHPSPLPHPRYPGRGLLLLLLLLASQPPPGRNPLHPSLAVLPEPVRRIYANPSFT